MLNRTLRRSCAVLAALAALTATCGAAAAPLRTWGVDPPAPEDTTKPAPDDNNPPPTKPPAPPAHADEPAAPRQDRTVGPGGLRYVLEGVEVRGNTSTLARVILGFVPFKRGMTLDVDDKELLLTRFRLLGTGFFRDVQLSLRRGTKRGYVVLVVDVVERNTIVVNDLWLGLSADAEPSGSARPLTAFGGIDISETNLAGTGVALGGAIALADGQLALRTRISDPSFLRSSWLAEAQLLYNNAQRLFR